MYILKKQVLLYCPFISGTAYVNSAGLQLILQGQFNLQQEISWILPVKKPQHPGKKNSGFTNLICGHF
jgi:hypothetical protein